MKNFRILTVAAFSLMLLSGCANNLPQGQVPMASGPLSVNSDASSTPTPTGSTAKEGGSSSPNASPSSSSMPGVGNGDTNDSQILPGVVDNPDQRNQKLVPNPAPGSGDPRAGTGGSGEIIDGARDSVGAGNKEDKKQAAESYIAFVNLINEKDYASACEYVKLTPSQGTDCLAAMDKLNIGSRTYPVGLKIDRLDNGVINGDMALLNKLVFVYDGDKRLMEVPMFRPTDGSGKWKTLL